MATARRDRGLSGVAALAPRMIAGGLRAQLCCLDTTQLDARFIGRGFGEALLRDGRFAYTNFMLA